MFWSKNKKNSYIPLHTPVLLYKRGLRGYTLHRYVFVILQFQSLFVIFQEALRIFPVVTVFGRRLTEDTHIGMFIRGQIQDF